MKKATATRGLPVLEIAEGTTVGSVDKLIIDRKTKAVVYFTLSDNTLVQLRDCVGIGNDCVVIRSKDIVKKVYDNRDIAEKMDIGIEIDGLRVMSDGGNIIGNITDFEYERKTGALVTVYFDNGESAEAERVLSISPALIFVAEGAAAPAEEAAPEANTTAMPGDDETYAYLLGRTVKAAVESDDKLFSIAEGTLLTREVLDDAQKHDAMLKIALQVD